MAVNINTARQERPAGKSTLEHVLELTERAENAADQAAVDAVQAIDGQLQSAVEQAIAEADISPDWDGITNKPAFGLLAGKDKVAVEDIDASGSPDAGKVLAGDGSWVTMPGGEGGSLPDEPVDGISFAVADGQDRIAFAVTDDGNTLLKGSSLGGSIAPTAPVQAGIAYFPTPQGAILIDLATDDPIPTAKSSPDAVGTATINVDGTVLRVPGTIAVQGSSTARWPKKNWKFRVFSDEGLSGKLQIKFGDSVPSTSWVLKAEWVDPSMMRNALSYRLYEAVYKSRKSVPALDVDKAWWGKEGVLGGLSSAATGVPKVYPAIMTINGEYYGMMIMTLKNEPEMYNLQPGNPDHILFEFDSRGDVAGVEETGKSWGKFRGDSIDKDASPVGEWILWEWPKWPDIDPSDQQRVRDLIDAAGAILNGSQQDFDEGFEDCFDRDNLIDMTLVMDAICDYDGRSQDILIASYDMKKLFFYPWDKDTSFGMSFDNSGISKNDDEMILDYNNERVSQKPWYKIYHNDPSAVETRYAQLRNEGIFSVRFLEGLMRDLTRSYPQIAWRQEHVKWNEMLVASNGKPDPNGSPRSAINDTSSFQILDWFEGRLAYLDSRYNYNP